jgi:hypothetical protein
MPEYAWSRSRVLTFFEKAFFKGDLDDHVQERREPMVVAVAVII